MNNPFEIKTPENSSAEEIVQLFVDVFTDFNKVLEANHTFLNGPRGSGKSMMFRYMQPDCQRIVSKKDIRDLDYFAIYIPIKLTSINVVDLERLEKHANVILNEHLLVTLILSRSLKFVIDKMESSLNAQHAHFCEFYNFFISQLHLNGLSIEKKDTATLSSIEMLTELMQITEEQHVRCKQLCNSFAFKSTEEIYPSVDIALLDCIDFMLPIFSALRKIPCFPQGKPMYVLIDDAGYLNEIQTQILNTWVSYRMTGDLCFKISTQLDYKTYLTTTGKRIDAPHDYSEINIATIYTSSKGNYDKRIQSIVEKRLKYYLKRELSAKSFFPSDQKQDDEIAEIYDTLRRKYHNPQKEYAETDAANRYAVPTYIKKLKEKRSGSTYSYAGFSQLVNISSGIVRHFLAPASEMFAKQCSETNDQSDIDYIKDAVQNEIIYTYSEKFCRSAMETNMNSNNTNERELLAELTTLIDSLGQLFHKILLSDKTERRVFSIALTDSPDDHLQSVLQKGVQLGLLHEGSIGNKEGFGRCKRYVLCRVLAPYYKLDPNSFAGYQFMNSQTLKIALTDTKAFIRKFNKLQENSSDDLTLF
ncbi:MAG: hypothetical protein MJZ84_02205 [Paludibacteraceae bacterium]|nr:hypothetical protein [Paludibacteraceae bacterium]